MIDPGIIRRGREWIRTTPCDRLGRIPIPRDLVLDLLKLIEVQDAALDRLQTRGSASRFAERVQARTAPAKRTMVRT